MSILSTPRLLLFLLLVMLLALPASAFSGNGAGTQGDPYQITNTTQWFEMLDDSGDGAFYKLMNDLDFDGVTYTPRTHAWHGGLNGDGHTISNITASAPTGAYKCGLIGAYGGAASVNHRVWKLRLVNCDLTNNDGTVQYLGLLFGQVGNAYIERIDIDDTSSLTWSVSPDASDSMGSVVGRWSGSASTTYLRYVTSRASLVPYNSANLNVGGLIGYTDPPNMDYCLFAGTITDNNAKDGGLVGHVTGSDSNGFASDNYWDSTVSGTTDDSYQSNDDLGSPLTTAQAKTKSSYTNWNFDTLFVMSHANSDWDGYPALNMFYDYAPPPVADFSSDVVSGTSPLEVTFTDESTESPTNWTWFWYPQALQASPTEFSYSQNPVETFTYNANWSSGNTTHMVYGIGLYAENAAGDDTVYKDNYLTVARAAPTPGFEADAVVGTAPFTANFTDLSVDATSWLWQKNSGSGWVNFTSATEQNPTETFALSGTYSIRLVATNPAGSNELVKTDYITAGPYVTADFNVTPAAGESPLTVEFVDQSTGDPDAPDEWLWRVYHNDVLVESNESQDWEGVFTDEGWYDIRLDVAKGEVEDTKLTEDAFYVGLDPVAEFSMDGDTGYAPFTVSFTDESLYVPTDWLWEFGDGITSTDANPSHTYTQPGYYTVTLTVTNPYGTDSIEYEVLVMSVTGLPDVHIPDYGDEYIPPSEWNDLQPRGTKWVSDYPFKGYNSSFLWYMNFTDDSEWVFDNFDSFRIDIYDQTDATTDAYSLIKSVDLPLVENQTVYANYTTVVPTVSDGLKFGSEAWRRPYYLRGEMWLTDSESGFEQVVDIKIQTLHIAFPAITNYWGRNDIYEGEDVITDFQWMSLENGITDPDVTESIRLVICYGTAYNQLGVYEAVSPQISENPYRWVVPRAYFDYDTDYTVFLELGDDTETYWRYLTGYTFTPSIEATESSLVWTNKAGTAITTTTEDQYAYLSVDSGSALYDATYSSVKVLLYRYDPVAERWVQRDEPLKTYTTSIDTRIDDSIEWRAQDGTYIAQLVGYGGSLTPVVFVQSPELKVNENILSFGNLVDTGDTWLGFGSGGSTGGNGGFGLLLSVFIIGIFCFIPKLVFQRMDTMVILIFGTLGLVLCIGLGLIPLWTVLAAVILAIFYIMWGSVGLGQIVRGYGSGDDNETPPAPPPMKKEAEITYRDIVALKEGDQLRELTASKAKIALDKGQEEKWKK